MSLLATFRRMTDAEIDEFLSVYDCVSRIEQRRLIARWITERELLLNAAKEASECSWDRVRVQKILGDAIEVVERESEES